MTGVRKCSFNANDARQSVNARTTLRMTQSVTLVSIFSDTLNGTPAKVGIPALAVENPSGISRLRF